MSAEPMKLNPEHERALLRLARDTARHTLSGASDPPPIKPSVPGSCGGVFVTFWRGHDLRGCVGTFASHADIADAVFEATRASLRDPRFETTPITLRDLSRMNLEISVLTTPTRTSDPLSLIPGVHGIIIRHGERSGCFLPRVASDRGWSAGEFLANCCRMKAGLPADAWRRPDVDVLLFHAHVFSESESAARI